MGSSKIISFSFLACTLFLMSRTSLAQLTPDFYNLTCPKVFKVVGSVVKAAVARENRMGASLLRLHFHDCFVNRCDASLLLDDTSSFRGEKTAHPNVNSARGFEVIDDIKSNVERVCPADDMVALAGAHTIGQARCTNFRPHVYNDTNVDPLFASLRRINCPVPNGLGDNNLAPLDARTSDHFDNSYYNNLLINQGLLHSDMQLLSGGSTDWLVEEYSRNPIQFNVDFAAAMIKMGDISPLTGMMWREHQ
ncbi:peroxidase 4 [Tanacetum coccineum]